MSEYTTNLPMESEYLNTHQPGFKRRRFNTNEVTGSPSFFPVFSNVAGQPQASSLAHSGTFGKRSRLDNEDTILESSAWTQSVAKARIVTELQKLVEHQAAAIDRLKSEKENVETALSDTKDALEKTNSENKILKRAVAIQQERQNQTAAELAAAYKYRVEAEERIKKLEHLNISLQYRVQSMSAHLSFDDFMGFTPRPPDVC